LKTVFSGFLSILSNEILFLNYDCIQSVKTSANNDSDSIYSGVRFSPAHFNTKYEYLYSTRIEKSHCSHYNKTLTATRQKRYGRSNNNKKSDIARRNIIPYIIHFHLYSKRQPANFQFSENSTTKAFFLYIETEKKNYL
jgi:hypothetical protein